MPPTIGVPGRILVVEDEGLIADYIAAVLRKAGHEVVGVVASSEEVFARTPELRPDVILMDIRIEGPLDGIQTVAKLRETLDIPVIYLSAHSDRATIDRARAAGACEVIYKPLNSSKLLAAIKGCIERSHAVHP